MAFIELKNLFSIGKRDKVLSNVDQTSKGFVSCGHHRAENGAAWTSFGAAAAQMVSSQNQDVKEQADTLASQFAELGKLLKALGDDEARNGEDFRDIQERYEVLFRTNEHYIEIKYDYKQACNALTAAIAKNTQEESSPKYEKNKEKLIAAIDKARDNKRLHLGRYKTQMLALMEQRRKYNHFKVRRLMEGWTRYGKALQRTCEEETALLTKMQDTLNEMKAKISQAKPESEPTPEEQPTEIVPEPEPEPEPQPEPEPEPESEPENTEEVKPTEPEDEFGGFGAEVIAPATQDDIPVDQDPLFG